MLLKREDIEREYTKKISEYIGQGYVINLASIFEMPSIIGPEELAKVDLRKGNEVLRIYLDKGIISSINPEYAGTYYGSQEVLSLIIKRYVEDEEFYSDTLWLKEGEEIYRKDYYYIEKSQKKDGEAFVDTLDEILRIWDLQHKRRENRKIAGQKIYLRSKRAIDFCRNLVAKRSTYKRISNDYLGGISILRRIRYIMLYTISFRNILQVKV